MDYVLRSKYLIDFLRSKYLIDLDLVLKPLIA